MEFKIGSIELYNAIEGQGQAKKKTPAPALRNGSETVKHNNLSK